MCRVAVENMLKPDFQLARNNLQYSLDQKRQALAK